MRKAKGLAEIEARMEKIPEGTFRREVLSVVKEFKTNWIKLGQCLYTVKKDKLYKDWGFMTFEAYCAGEIGIKRATAVKLLNSYYFLEHEEPELLRAYGADDTPVSRIPHYESVNALRLAKRSDKLSESDYASLKRLAIDEGREPKDVGKELRSILLASRGEEDPSEARRKRRRAAITRMVSALNNFKKEAEAAKLLPQKVMRDIERLVSELKEQI